MSAISFTKKNYTDTASSGSGLVAADMNKIEKAIVDLNTVVTSLQSSVSATAFNPNIVARKGFVLSASSAIRIGNINFIQINIVNNNVLSANQNIAIADIKGINAPMIRGVGSSPDGTSNITASGVIQFNPNKNINVHATLYAQFVVLAN